MDPQSRQRKGDRPQICRPMAESYAGARDLHEISCHDMEMMMAAMVSGPDVIGARQAGAGFGGCMVACLEGNKGEAFAKHVASHYQASTGILPHVYRVQAVPGASRMAL